MLEYFKRKDPFSHKWREILLAEDLSAGRADFENEVVRGGNYDRAHLNGRKRLVRVEEVLWCSDDLLMEPLSSEMGPLSPPLPSGTTARPTTGPDDRSRTGQSYLCSSHQNVQPTGGVYFWIRTMMFLKSKRFLFFLVILALLLMLSQKRLDWRWVCLVGKYRSMK